MQGKEIIKLEKGMVFKTNTYGDITIVEYIDSRNVVVQFQDGTMRTTYKSQVLSGKVRNPNLPGPSNAKAESFGQIEKLKQKHNNKYDYSKTVYTFAKDKITIVCKTHGDFTQTYSDHLSGKGCQKCARENTTNANKFRTGKNTENVICEFLPVWGDTYDYSKVNYTGSQDKIEIICRKHGSFFQTDKTHLKGHGCPLCANERTAEIQTYTTDHFVQLCKDKFNNNYDYSEVDYKGGKEHITLICKDHGEFRILASVHLHQGSGCPSCNTGGFNPKMPAYLYVLYAGDMTKVGITNRDVGKRLKEICSDSGHIFKIVSEFYFEDGYKCSDTETRVLRYLRSKYKNPVKKFCGSSECFFEVNRDELNSVLRSEVYEERV